MNYSVMRKILEGSSLKDMGTANMYRFKGTGHFQCLFIFKDELLVITFIMLYTVFNKKGKLLGNEHNRIKQQKVVLNSTGLPFLIKYSVKERDGI